MVCKTAVSGCRSAISFSDSSADLFQIRRPVFILGMRAKKCCISNTLLCLIVVYFNYSRKSDIENMIMHPAAYPEITAMV